MKPQLSTRQAQIVERVARQKPDKVIADELGISIATVRAHIQRIANRIPGPDRRRARITLFFFGVVEE
jgi:DNA-binding CsgD family transcriptional regulator